MRKCQEKPKTVLLYKLSYANQPRVCGRSETQAHPPESGPGLLPHAAKEAGQREKEMAEDARMGQRDSTQEGCGARGWQGCSTFWNSQLR